MQCSSRVSGKGADLTSILLGLSAAISWGAADFAGGISSRRIGIFKTVFFQELIGLVLLFPAVLILGEQVPPIRSWIFACLAGFFGNLGLLLLYRALETGNMSIAAPVSALITALLPVIVGSILEGFPGPIIFLGFGFALLAVWLISQNESHSREILSHFSDLRLPLLAGIGFGLFFVLIHEATRTSLVWPMIASRSTGLLMVGSTIHLRHAGWTVPSNVRHIVLLNGLLDLGGNIFYIIAGQAGRLDISSALSSLYPGATVLLAWLFLRERLSRMQWLGVLFALLAIIMFTL